MFLRTRAWTAAVHTLTKRMPLDSLAVVRTSPSVFWGFTGLLILMGALIVDSSLQIRDVTLNSAHLRKQYAERDALLDDLRTTIYHASTLTRDYFFGTDKSSTATIGPALQDIRQRTYDTLTRYEQLLPRGERQGFQQLSESVHSYVQALSDAVVLGTSDSNPAREALFRGVVLRHRSEVIDLLAQVNTIDRRDTDEEELSIQTLHERFQRRVGTMSSLSFIVSVVLAFVIISRHRSLERKVAMHFDEVQTARQDLRLFVESVDCGPGRGAEKYLSRIARPGRPVHDRDAHGGRSA